MCAKMQTRSEIQVDTKLIHAMAFMLQIKNCTLWVMPAYYNLEYVLNASVV